MAVPNFPFCIINLLINLSIRSGRMVLFTCLHWGGGGGVHPVVGVYQMLWSAWQNVVLPNANIYLKISLRCCCWCSWTYLKLKHIFLCLIISVLNDFVFAPERIWSSFVIYSILWLLFKISVNLDVFKSTVFLNRYSRSR